MAWVLLGAVVPKISLDVAAIAAFATLILGGVLAPTEAVAGFGNTTLLTVACMFILAEALQRTGAVRGVGRWVEVAARKNMRFLLIGLLPLVMLLSGVMSNTAVVVLLLPVLVAATQRSQMSPSRVLLPLSYASIIGGTLTLVGTTTTLLVDGMLLQAGRDGIGLFGITPMGAVFCVVGLIYLVLAGPKLLPNRTGLVTPITAEATRQYLTEIAIPAGSPFVGKQLGDFPALLKKVRFLQIVRGEEILWPPLQHVELQENDVLLVKAQQDELVRLLDQRGLRSRNETSQDEESIHSHNVALAEVMVAPGSSLANQTVQGAKLRYRFGVSVLAVLRKGAHLRQHIGGLALRVGDILLVQGEPSDISRLTQTEDDLMVLGGTRRIEARRHKLPIAIAIVAAALLSAAFGWMPLVVAVLLGAAGLVVTGCVSRGQAYRAVDLRILVILGSMLALGAAASKTGLAADIAGGMVSFGERFGPHGILAMVYLATAILTELVTNAGTASIMIPIALSISDRMQHNHEPYVYAVALAASCSFLTPVGYQTNLLVHGPGGYRLMDYLRLGAPLAILLWALATWLLPIVYGF